MLGRNELVTDDSGRVSGQGHRRARGTAGSAGRAVGRLPRHAHAGAAVRRQERDHPEHRRPGGGQPQRIRRRVDQARSDRGDRHQQEGLTGHRRHAAGGSGRLAATSDWRISRTIMPIRWPTGWRRASPSWSPRRTGSSSTASSARPASRTGGRASSCRAWPSCCTSATADHGSSSTPGLRMPGRVQRRLRRRAGRRERVRALPVIPGAVVATDRVVMGDGAAGAC